MSLTPGMYKLTLKDKFKKLQPFWEQLGSNASPNDRSCIGIGNSYLGVCRPTTDVLSISNECIGAQRKYNVGRSFVKIENSNIIPTLRFDVSGKGQMWSQNIIHDKLGYDRFKSDAKNTVELSVGGCTK